jgi:hypothetical protein
VERGHTGTVEESAPGGLINTWVCNTFFNALRAVIGVPGRQKLIMWRIVPFPTPRASRRTGFGRAVPGTLRTQGRTSLHARAIDSSGFRPNLRSRPASSVRPCSVSRSASWLAASESSASTRARSSSRSPRFSSSPAIDQDTCELIASYLGEIRTELAAVGVELHDEAFLFSNDPAHSRPSNPDWATHKVAEAAVVARVKLDIKGGRHYTASQLLAGGFDLRDTAARLGHSGGGSTTLRHYADPVPEVDRRAAVFLAQLTARSAVQAG